MLNQISQIAIQSQTNTANVVILDNIMEGVDGAASFGYSVTPRSLTVEDSQTQQYIHDHQMDVRVLRSAAADLEKLQVMDANSEPVKVTTQGIDGSVVFFDESQIVRAAQFDQVLADRFLITRSTVVGYSGDAEFSRYPVLGTTRDLMEVYDTSTGSSVLLAGFRSQGVTRSQTGGVQTITRSSTGGLARAISPEFLWPFVGTRLEAQVEITSITAPGSLLLIEAKDDTGSIITSANVNFSTAGIKTIAFTVPTTTVTIEFFVNCGTTAGHTLSFKEPILRILS